MIFVYPKLLARCGVIYTAAIGTVLAGGSVCLLLVCDSVPSLIPLCIGFAVGNGLARPAFPAYLGNVSLHMKFRRFYAIDILL